jgi:hypothetical protein
VPAARAALARAEAIDARLPPNPGSKGSAVRTAADLLLASGRPREARARYLEALVLLEAKHGAHGIGLLDALLGLGTAELASGQAAPAVITAERAVAIATGNGNAVAQDVQCAARFLLARARWASGDRPGSPVVRHNWIRPARCDHHQPRGPVRDMGPDAICP